LAESPPAIVCFSSVASHYPTVGCAVRVGAFVGSAPHRISFGAVSKGSIRPCSQGGWHPSANAPGGFARTPDHGGGATPGDALPVFDCDFGKLGIQICYDMEFPNGWTELARRGAELIAWPTQSPQTSQPAFRARAHRCYIVSSTWRHNASIFEPTGKIAAQIKPPQSILVHELDLSYALLPWSSKLRNGEALRQAYSDRVGYHYYEDEDCGIFWSNDPKTAIGEMVRSLGVLELEEEMARVREFYRAAGVRI